MTPVCAVCKANPVEPNSRAITSGICPQCLSAMNRNRQVPEALDAAVLLMQGNPRQVIAANTPALKLFEKQAGDIEGLRGGQVFDCLHSFSEAGCGKDVHCEHCVIKNAIVDTFATGTPHRAVSSSLMVRKGGATETRALQVSTEKTGELALVRIERYDSDTTS